MWRLQFCVLLRRIVREDALPMIPLNTAPFIRPEWLRSRTIARSLEHQIRIRCLNRGLICRLQARHALGRGLLGLRDLYSRFHLFILHSVAAAHLRCLSFPALRTFIIRMT